MNKFVYLFLTIAALVCATLPANADREYHHRKGGVGTYGVNNEKIKCPHCDKWIYKYESHTCYTENTSSSRSSRSSRHSRSSDAATDAAADALIASNPDLLINQTYVSDKPVVEVETPTVIYTGNKEKKSKSSNGKSIFWDVIVPIIAVGALVWYVVFRD